MEPDVGIEGYLTSTVGVGGLLKASPDDFVVEEISQPPLPSADGAYTIATIRVREWETNRLVRQLARSLHISRPRIGCAGAKAKPAVRLRPIDRPARREAHLPRRVPGGGRRVRRESDGRRGFRIVRGPLCAA